MTCACEWATTLIKGIARHHTPALYFSSTSTILNWLRAQGTLVLSIKFLTVRYRDHTNVMAQLANDKNFTRHTSFCDPSIHRLDVTPSIEDVASELLRILVWPITI